MGHSFGSLPFRTKTGELQSYSTQTKAMSADELNLHQQSGWICQELCQKILAGRSLIIMPCVDSHICSLLTI